MQTRGEDLPGMPCMGDTWQSITAITYVEHTLQRECQNGLRLRTPIHHRTLCGPLLQMARRWRYTFTERGGYAYWAILRMGWNPRTNGKPYYRW